MSRAQKRNGQRIYNAAKELETALQPEACGFMTIGQVMSVVEMSMPTVKKYLDIIAEAGVMQKCIIDGRQYIYRFTA